MQDNSLVGALRREIEYEFFPDGLNIEQIKLLDRVDEMISKAFSAGYKTATMYDAGEWSNNACLGYVIAGAQKAKLTKDQTAKIVRSVYSEFDWKTIEEAKRIYENSDY